MLSIAIQQELLRKCLHAAAELGVQQWDPITRKLISWLWPLTDRYIDELVAIYGLEQYRATHFLQNPNCFCATADRPLVESAIFIASTGPYRGFTVVGCAQAEGESCEYFMPIEHIYLHGNIPRQYYPARAPPAISRYTAPYAADAGVDIALQPSRPNCQPERNKQSVILPRYAPPPNAPVSTSEILRLIDDWIKPGVPLSQFRHHIALCDCGLVTTTRAFDKHQCQSSQGGEDVEEVVEKEVHQQPPRM